MPTKAAKQSEVRGSARSHPSGTKSSSGVFSRLVAKLKPKLFRSKKSSPVAAPPSIQPPTRRSGIPAPSQDPASVQRRQAALQQCGLVPVPRKDLSQLEQELDRRFGHAATREWEHSELSTAEKVRREWEAKNEIQPAKQGGDEIVEEATRGTSPNRRSIRSLTTESSPPALSPATTASSLPSVATPRDSEWRSGIGRDLEGLDVVYETIPESPEPTAPKRRMSTRVFRSNKRNSTSSRKSTDSERSLRWSATAKDLSFRPYDRPRSGGPTLPSAPAPTGRNEPALVQPQSAIDQSQSKFTKSKSKSVIASLGFKKTRKIAPQPAIHTIPPVSLPPVREPTVKVVGGLGSLVQDLNEIEDEESRRLTELAFMDY